MKEGAPISVTNQLGHEVTFFDTPNGQRTSYTNPTETPLDRIVAARNALPDIAQKYLGKNEDYVKETDPQLKAELDEVRMGLLGSIIKDKETVNALGTFLEFQNQQLYIQESKNGGKK